MKRTRGPDAFVVLNTIFLVALSLATVYPFWNVLVVSLSSYKDYGAEALRLWPKSLDFSAYAFMLGMDRLWISYKNTLIVTGFGTLLATFLTVTTGYVLAKGLKGTRIIMFLIVLTMLFDGGIIPRYMIVRGLGIMNTLLALILPLAMGTWNLIIVRNYFGTLPAELEESARMDGARDLTILFRIILPVSKPIIATIALFYAVSFWNNFFEAVMYITDFAKWPLQLFLRAMLFENAADTMSGGDNPALLGMPVKMAAIIMAAAPIMLAYPFFQRYFVKGLMVGAVKG